MKRCRQCGEMSNKGFFCETCGLCGDCCDCQELPGDVHDISSYLDAVEPLEDDDLEVFEQGMERGIHDYKEEEQ